MKLHFLKAVSLLALSATVLTGCNDANIASANLSKAADNFKISRRIVFYNGISGEYMLSIEGRCAFDASNARKLDVTCKIGPKEYKKHSLGLSDNVTYFSEQLYSADVSVYHYRVTFKPQAILPDIRLKADGAEVIKAITPGAVK